VRSRAQALRLIAQPGPRASRGTTQSTSAQQAVKKVKGSVNEIALFPKGVIKGSVNEIALFPICAALSTGGHASKQILMCSLRSLTCLQVQVLPRQGMVGPSSGSRLTEQRREGKGREGERPARAKTGRGKPSRPKLAGVRLTGWKPLV
jgi:hypothetical protein